MDKKELVKFLRDYNHWRRGAEIPMPSPKELGIALDIAISIIEKIEAVSYTHLTLPTILRV